MFKTQKPSLSILLESSQGSPKLQSQECCVPALYLAVHMEIMTIKLILPAIRQRNLLVTVIVITSNQGNPHETNSIQIIFVWKSLPLVVLKLLMISFLLFTTNKLC